MARAIITSELGEEIQCAKCREFWPLDAEFFFFTKGRPHSWCKACYIGDPKTMEKRERWRQKVSKGGRRESPPQTYTFPTGFPFATS